MDLYIHLGNYSISIIILPFHMHQGRRESGGWGHAALHDAAHTFLFCKIVYLIYIFLITSPQSPQLITIFIIFSVILLLIVLSLIFIIIFLFIIIIVAGVE